MRGWDFGEAAYCSSGACTDELLATAKASRLAMYEQDDRLYCSPSLLRVLPAERTILIDRARERRMRPSMVVEQHEFARDIYLLDRSGMTETRDGFVVSFPARTATKSPGGVITAITESGQ